MKIVLTECLSKYYHNNCLYTLFTNPKIDKIMFENWQGINPIGLIETWSEYKNKYLFINIKI